MNELFLAFGLVLVLEGCLWCLWPLTMKRAAAQAALADSGIVRIGGLAAACAGVLLVWFVKG